MLRMCGTVRRMTPRDVADGCGVDPAVMDALLSDGGTVNDTLRALSFIHAHTILLPPMSRTPDVNNLLAHSTGRRRSAKM